MRDRTLLLIVSAPFGFGLGFVIGMFITKVM